MLDDPFKTALLIDILNESLPFEVSLTPELIKSLAEKDDPVDVFPTAMVLGIEYLGDAAGIVCCFEGPDGAGIVASLTHLRVHPSFDFAREVVSYQKHRVKKLKREDAGKFRVTSMNFEQFKREQLGV